MSPISLLSEDLDVPLVFRKKLRLTAGFFRWLIAQVLAVTTNTTLSNNGDDTSYWRAGISFW